MWMGPRAFAYYLPAAIRYLKSEHAEGDVEFVAALVDVIRFRREEEDFHLAATSVNDLIRYVTRHVDRFGEDRDDRAELLEDYRQLQDELET